MYYIYQEIIMPQNPLQQHFRQPKIYISLPSQGAYNKQGTINGDIAKIPVYGMTGMDEIILKTPDALLSGESTVNVIKSCCPNINNGWDVSMLDADMILTAIRIATYGNTIDVTHTCPKCSHENGYALDLGVVIDHFTHCKFDNAVVLQDLTINIQPLNYKQSTEFKLKNFKLQQKLSQAEFVEDASEQQLLINGIFKELSEIQTELYIASVESVQTGSTVVTERDYIAEFLSNCDKMIFDKIKESIEKNQKTWQMPLFPAKCEECASENKISLDLDQASFFALA
jgi:hypothetical protein